MRIGMLTSGGDVPGLNAAIRAVARRALVEGVEVLGFRNGWLGLLENDYMDLTLRALSGILPQGGTILGASRINPIAPDGTAERVLETAKAHELDAMVVLGGDGSLRGALEICERGLPLVGIPKTIDNDVPGTEYCIGFDSGMNAVMDALDKLHPTAAAHHRIMVVEVMGNRTGWLAVLGGLAGGADVIVSPEIPLSLNDIRDRVHARAERGSKFSIIAVAEGSPIEGISREAGPGGAPGMSIGHALAAALSELTSTNIRVTVLGYVQRGGSPTAFDRITASRMGAKAVELLLEGKSSVMVAMVNGEIVPVPLSEVREPPRPVDPAACDLAQLFS
jgi:6-phosphofructokinase